MSQYIRNRKRWTINECLQLQREFELLELSIDEIAKKHKRTPNAIMQRLDKEGFADYNVLYSEYYKLGFGNNSLTEENNNLTFTANENVNVNENENENVNENSYDYNELKNHLKRLENQILSLTKLVIMQNENSKSVVSLFD